WRDTTVGLDVTEQRIMVFGISHCHDLYVTIDTHVFQTDDFWRNNILGAGCTYRRAAQHSYRQSQSHDCHQRDWPSVKLLYSLLPVVRNRSAHPARTSFFITHTSFQAQPFSLLWSVPFYPWAFSLPWSEGSEFLKRH